MASNMDTIRLLPKSSRQQPRMSYHVASLALAGIFAVGACSFLVDKNAVQCQGDWDCARFGNAVCDVKNRVCVAPPSPDGALALFDAATEQPDAPAAFPDAPVALPDAVAAIDVGDPCQGPGGCFLCLPSDERQILAGCTDSTCVPFDNSRLTNLNSDGTLTPLP